MHRNTNAIRLADDAVSLLLQYKWGGNIRQLRNITEQLSILEQKGYFVYHPKAIFT
ncbi:MAG: hypothetical protein R2793_01790 [Flavobacteriaceae bacterium]